MAMLPEGKLYIDGKLRQAAGGKTYDDISPWTGQVIAKAADASKADVEEAIVAARRAFDTTDWATNKDKRVKLVTKFQELLRANKERLGEIAKHEVGAATGAIAMAHVDNALNGGDDYLKVFPDVHWEKDYGLREFRGANSHRKAVYEPIGVVAAITPWNVPLYVQIGKVHAGLLAGCTVILKPAPDTPLMGAIMGELADEAGFPPGVFQVVTGADPAMAGEMMVTDPRVDLISFTGSTAIGRHIMEKGAATLKRVFLELGGKSAHIILDDAPDFQTAVASSMLIFHAGQGCAVTSRLLVPKSRYQEAVAILEAAYKGFGDNWGDINNPGHIMGPVVSKKQQDRVLSYIEVGKKEGARLLAGGKARPDKGEGFFIEPTVFVDVKNNMRIAQEEIFGPVLAVIPYEDDEDAIRIANESEYGLSGLITGSEERAVKMAKRIRTGTIGVNWGMCIAGDIPFGGYKSSGIGREWGREGIEEFLETKLLAVGGR